MQKFCTSFFFITMMLSMNIFGICVDKTVNDFIERIFNEEATFKPTLDLKAGYFNFSDSQMRNVFDRGGLDVRLSGTFCDFLCFQLYGSVEYIDRYGRSLNGHQKTSIWQIPFSLGVKSNFVIRPNVLYYLTIGPRYFFVHVHNNSSFVNRDMNANGLGGFCSTGFTLSLPKCLYLDIFAEYSYGRIHFHSSKKRSYGQRQQVGGWTFGAGIGYKL